MLKEIKRVLKPTGILYASTNGKNHLKELADAMGNFDEYYKGKLFIPMNFILENSYVLLIPYFNDIEIAKYNDQLLVTNHEDLFKYQNSRLTNSEYIYTMEGKKELLNYFKSLSSNSFEITIERGLLIAKNNKYK